MTLICAGLLLIDESLPFPGYLALVPVMGAVFIIMSGQAAYANRFCLSSRAMVLLGLVSYPLYLWHWPILAFGRILYPFQSASMAFNLTALLLALIMAILTYRYIEQPIRQIKHISSSSLGLFIAMLLVGLIGLSAVWKNGFDYRKISEEYTHRKLVSLLKNNYGLGKQCSPDNSLSNPQCANQPHPNMLLWGDSYAMHLAQALDKSPHQVAFRQQTMSACRPIIDFAVVGDKIYNQQWAQRCIKHNQALMAWLSRQPEIQYVVLASPFNYLDKALVDDHVVTMTDDVFIEKLQKTLNMLIAMGKKPVVIAPPPPSGFHTGNCWKYHAKDNSQQDCNFSQQKSEAIASSVYQRLQRVNHLAPVLKLSDFICADGLCRATIDDFPQYRDQGHLSETGSAALGKKYDVGGEIVQMADKFYQPPR